MSKETRRTFLKTVGLAAGIAGVSGATASDTPKMGIDRVPRVGDAETSLSTELPASDWATFQFDARNSGYNPDARDVEGTPWIEWSESLADELANEISTPTIVDGVAYVASEYGQAAAFDLESREFLWKREYTDGSTYIDEAPTVTDGTMYISHEWRVFALDTETGASLWTFENPETGSPANGCDAPQLGASSTTVKEGSAFVKMRIGTQAYGFALSADTGDLQWSVELSGGDIEYSTNYGGQMDTADHVPAVVDGVVYFAEGGTVYAFDAADGAGLWETPVHVGDDVYGPEPNAPAVVDGTVYVTVNYRDDGGSNPERRTFTTALSADGGEIRWQRELAGDIHLTSPVVADGTVYVGETQAVWALDADDGTVRWKGSETDEFRYTTVAELSVAESTVYYPREVDDEDSQEIAAFDTDDGSLKWQVPLRASVNAPSGCALVGETVYVVDDIGVLYTIGGPTEATNWRRALDFERSESFRTASADDTSVYAATNATLRAFDREEGTERWSVSLGENENDTFRFVWTTVVDGTVYCSLGGDGGGSYNFVYAIDAATGTTLWHEKAPDGTGNPVVVDDAVYVGTESSFYGSAYVTAYDSDDGSVRWRSEFDSDDPSISVEMTDSVAVRDGTVYAATTEGTYALETTDGSETWTDDRDATAVVADGDTVFVSTDEPSSTVGKRIVALDPADGSEMWTSNTGGNSLTLADDMVYVIAGEVSDAKELFALNADDGSEQWTFDTKYAYPTYGYDYEATLTDPTVEDGVVYIASDDRRVYALDADDGDTLQRFELFGNSRDTPAVHDGIVYAVDENRVYSFDYEE
ncbi:PQQ-binding-like beta-propeller repeat protein [Haladaptatus sp. CMAA 1911]|uniref:outer membrane protein assembly factor BamB family protein n=1 Tax=unclassified Haladaptatus TaxID=2622732 RepID=UPI0037544425